MKKQRVGTGLAFSKTKQIILVELVKKKNIYIVNSTIIYRVYSV